MRDLPRYTKGISFKLQELKVDLLHFLREAQRVFDSPGLLESPFFLEQMAEIILSLDLHAEEIQFLNGPQEEAELIHFILNSPWGAPFVMERSLVEAAKIYPDEEPSFSSLKTILKLFITHSRFEESPLFEGLTLLLKGLPHKKEAA